MSAPSESLLLDSDWRAEQALDGSLQGLRKSVFSRVILLLYRVLNGQRRRRIGRVLIHLAQRLEGGAMQSATARIIMRNFHGVEIGLQSYGNCFDPAVVPPGVRIGNYVSIAPGARLLLQNHPLDGLSTHPVFYEDEPGVSQTARLAPGHLEIGHDVWIGYNAIVTPGCNRIGNGAVLAAGAVVTKDVDDYTVVEGNPARPIRTRLDARSQHLAADGSWWDLPPDAARDFEPTFSLARDNPIRPPCIASIIIPAHNEAAVIGRCLRSLLADTLSGELEIIVVANGCRDATGDLARSFGNDVRVVEVPAASKVEALNIGDRTACHFPRFYVNADIQVDVKAIRETCGLLKKEGVLAASPKVVWDLSRCSFAVRCFYYIWRFQPYFDNGRLGSGVYALNAIGHKRLIKFPDVIAADDYVRLLFSQRERATGYRNAFVVTPPSNLQELIHIKTHCRQGTSQLHAQLPGTPKRDNARQLRFLGRLLVRPYLWLYAAIYIGVSLATLYRAVRSRHATHASPWGRDLSSRQFT